MKRKTFLRLSLLIPYLALGAAAVLTLPQYNSIMDSDNWVLLLLFIFTFSSIVWGPLYTWMTAVLLLWGIGRSEAEIRRACLLSPFILACSMSIPSAALDPESAAALALWSVLRNFDLEHLVTNFFPYFQAQIAFGFIFSMLLLGGLCVIFGYVFVFPVLWLERALIKRGFLLAESA